MLEIHKYVPPYLLRGIELEHLELDDFLGLLAKARYLQNIEVRIVAKAIFEAFGE